MSFLLFVPVLNMVVRAEILKLLLSMTVNDCGEGRVWGKGSLVVETWLKSVEEYSNGGLNTSKLVRNASRIRERTSTGYRFSGEDFQNTGTFIVVRSSVFSISSAHNTQLARDAHNALWNGRRRNQEQNCSRIGTETGQHECYSARIALVAHF